MTFKKLIPVLSFSLLFFACKKEEQQEFTDSPIIESYLEPGSVFKVRITRQIPFSDNVTYSSDDIDHLSITVSYNNTEHVLTPLNDGNYADSGITITAGTYYNLDFNYNKQKVSAYTYIPQKPQNVSQSATTYTIEKFAASSGLPSGGSFTMPDPLTIRWQNTDDSYYLVIVENMESTLDPIRDFGDNPPPGNRFKKTPTNSSSVDISAQEFQYYGTHRLILYHVLPDYAALYEATSTSSQNLTNPSTSISNGYGIFTGLNADTLFVEVTEP